MLICENEEQAAGGVKEIMLDKSSALPATMWWWKSSSTGPEVSVLSFTGGKVVKPMVSSMDHKRANDHDTGLNTGGMGTVAPLLHPGRLLPSAWKRSSCPPFRP